MIRPEILEKIEQNCICLEKYGLSDLAWSKADAQNLIRALMNENIGIIGGTVYKLKQDQLEILGDHWHCEPIKMAKDYTRSKLQSLNYIESYVVEKDEKIIFSITFYEQLVSKK